MKHEYSLSLSLNIKRRSTWPPGICSSPLTVLPRCCWVILRTATFAFDMRVNHTPQPSLSMHLSIPLPLSGSKRTEHKNT